MSDDETKALAAEVDLKGEVAGFLSEFQSFADDIHAKLQEQDDRMTKLDRKMTLPGRRPALARGDDLEAPHQKAFNAYLRSGDDDGLRHLEIEGKALATTGDGGYLVDPQTSATVMSVLNATASIRAIANVVHVEATSYDVLVDHTELGAGWTTETSTIADTATPSIDRISIDLHELSAMPKASQRLLDDSAFDIEGWLAARIAEKFARSEAAAFINGDGEDMPRGILDYPREVNAGAVWGELGYVMTGADGAFASTNASDAIVDLVYALGAEYRAGATFVMNSRTTGAVRKLKDNDGRFLWSDGLAAGEPARLMGYPVLVAEDMPDIGSDACAIAFGNFHSGYTIAERPDLRVLRDPFSAKPHVLFYATKRVGGGVSDFAAIKLLKFGTA
ncbi:phage major capsid protein [Pseudoroseicyclus sp. CXY001]|uniref:phage major capsid protein n=1 Tax=Pseudoroseicyclus sp. CXY001 TaxID=3242492 RepID=UPI003570B79B